ncbi:MAG: glycosyltransferase family 39 protein [Acidobacteriota bacterium]
MTKKRKEGIKEPVSAHDQQHATYTRWIAGSIAVTMVAAFLRFFWLGLKPLHHDEGVNGFFLTTLFRDGIYKYDPANYHGPTLYYIALVFTKLFGLETIPIRASVAIFGVLTVVLVLYLRPYIGRLGSLFAAALLALSPGMVFISRYFIHEIFFVFLSLAIPVAIVFFIERRRAGYGATAWAAVILMSCFSPSIANLPDLLAASWSPTAVLILRLAFIAISAALTVFVIRILRSWNEGRAVYLLLAAAAASLLFATKETAFITLGTLALACISVWIWRRMIGLGHMPLPSSELEDSDLTWQNFLKALGSGPDRALIVIAAVTVFIYLFVLFFSSLFTYPDGIGGAIKAYSIWTQTGSKDHTQNGFFAYLKWGMSIEAPVIILSAVGTLIALVKGRHRFAMFTGFWAFGLFTAYSLIPYKTPWLALSFLLPMCIVGGYGLNELVVSKDARARMAGWLMAAVAAAVMLYQTVDLNFFRYDDDQIPYVYAHTKRQFVDMMHQIDHYAEKSGKGREVKVQIISPDYWPMVWYVKDYPKAIFHGKLTDADEAEMIVAKKGDQDSEVVRRYSVDYKYVGIYPLRPGVDLVLLVRSDLAEEDAHDLYRLPLDSAP